MAVPLLFAGQGQAEHWISVGPSPLILIEGVTNAPINSGRIASIATHPSDPDHWLIGVGNGGVWETRDAGETWML